MYESFLIQIKVIQRRKYRDDSNIYFTRKRLYRVVGDGEESTGRLLPVLNSDEKHHFLSFSVFLIKIFLSRNMQRMLQKVPK